MHALLSPVAASGEYSDDQSPDEASERPCLQRIERRFMFVLVSGLYAMHTYQEGPYPRLRQDGVTAAVGGVKV